MRPSLKGIVPTLLTLAVSASQAGVLLEPEPAPEWKVSEWINSDPGTLAQNRGKLILIHFFQMWCPGCNEFSIPLFQKWDEMFGVRDDVLIVAIHTVFEAHDQQTPELLKQFIAEKGITDPVGIDAYPAPGAQVPITMDRFDTGGTPHVAIVDKDGDLRFSHFGRFSPEPIERFITRILEEENEPKLNIKSTPRDEVKRKSSNRAAARKEPPRSPQPSRPEPTDPAGLDPDATEDADRPASAERRGQAEGEEAEQEAQQDEEEKPGVPDPELSGSYKLHFEQLSKSCGERDRPLEVITQINVYQDRIEAMFSRPFLGIRQLTAGYNESGSVFQADAQQQGKERAGETVDVTLQMSGRFVSITDPPELEFDYYLDKRSEDGSSDCTIEGRGTGTRFRGR